MNKKASILSTLLLFVLILLIIFMSYEIYQNMPGELMDLEIVLPKDNSSLENVSEKLEMFYPNMRFASNSLSFGFAGECTPNKKERVYEAFEIISNETKILSFKETLDNPIITIFCSEVEKETTENTYVAGEGGPEKLLNSTLYPLIGGGRVYLYGTKGGSDCEYPVVEIHELMHVFGFNHITNKSSILYPYLDCDQRFDAEIISELIRLYSIEPKAELKIKNATASKSGIYLNFNIEIENIGLIDAKNSVLEIQTNENSIIDEFELDDIEPGTTQTLKVQNLKLPSRNTNEIVIEIKTSTEEFYIDNNFLEAKLN